MDNSPLPPLSRRGFLKQSGLVSLSASSSMQSLAAFFLPDKQPGKAMVYFLIRPADMLCLQFSFENCSHCLGTIYAHRNAQVTIRLPQQHIAEENFSPSLLPKDPVPDLDISGYSYLVFQLKKGHIHFDADKWLSWDVRRHDSIYADMLTVDESDPRSATDPASLTRFEFPFGLLLSPIKYNPKGDTNNSVFSWSHTARPREIDKRVELWTSRLKLSLAALPHQQAPAPIDPAFWITNYIRETDPPFGSPNPGNPPLDPNILPTDCDRSVLYQQASSKDPVDTKADQRVKTNKSFFEISPLGVTTKLLYKPGYAPSTKSKIVEWKQESSFGRDTYVEVVTSGWIFPYMIRCNFAVITRRVTILVANDSSSHPQTLEFVFAKFKRSQPEVDYQEAVGAAQASSRAAALRGTPFSSVRLLTLESPEFDLNANFVQIDCTSANPLNETKGIGDNNPYPIWTVTDYDRQQYYSFNFEGTDHNGTPVKFTSPFIFIPDKMPASQCDTMINAGCALDIDIISAHFTAAAIAAITFNPAGPAGGDAAQNFTQRNRAIVGGQKINYVINDSGATDAVVEPVRQSAANLQTDHLIFTSWKKPSSGTPTYNPFSPIDTTAASQVPFFPLLSTASVINDAVKAVVAPGANGSDYLDVCYPAIYLANGIYNQAAAGVVNQARIFLKLASDNTLPLFQPGMDLRTVGVLLRPQMQAAAFSLINGIVSSKAASIKEEIVTALNNNLNALSSDFLTAIQDYAGLAPGSIPTFNPLSFLPDMHILGQDIQLAQLIIKQTIGDYLQTAQEVANQFIPIIQTLQDTRSVTAYFEWTLSNDKLQDIAFVQWLHNSNPDIASSLKLSCTQVVPLPSLAPGAPAVQASTTTSCQLTNFALNFFDFVTVDFSEFTYTNSSAAGTHTTVNVSDVEFGGSLSFVNLLASLLQTLDDAIQIAIEAAGLDIDFSIPVPSISLPCFTITNIKIDTGVNIPFDIRSTSLSFGFNSIRDPFTISVALLGGGGSIGSLFDTSGILGFSASFEFGGYLGVDLIVAQGSLYIFAGIYYSAAGSDCIILGAYIRAGGELSVLDLISVSLTFYLDLQYQVDNNQTLLTGTCTITVSIHIAFFSIDVPVTFRHDLAGSAAGSNAHILASCDPNGASFVEPAGPALAGPNAPFPVPPTAKEMPPPQYGRTFKNQRIGVDKHVSETDWIYFIHSFAS